MGMNVSHVPNTPLAMEQITRVIQVGLAMIAPIHVVASEIMMVIATPVMKTVQFLPLIVAIALIGNTSMAHVIQPNVMVSGIGGVIDSPVMKPIQFLPMTVAIAPIGKCMKDIVSFLVVASEMGVVIVTPVMKQI